MLVKCTPIATMILRKTHVAFRNANQPSAVRKKFPGAILDDEMIVHSAALLL